MNGSRFLWLVSLCLPFCLTACHKDADLVGKVKFTFSFQVDEEPLQQDTCKYRNAAGNVYEVTEAQYFISNICLTRMDGTQVKITSDNSAHYVDADIAATLTWLPADEVPAGVYSTISFVFGLAPEYDYYYPNPPENNMSWPSYLGGGYHYMKINGKWQLANGTLSPFNLHLGFGQQHDAAGNITGFIDNTFMVSLPLSGFVIAENQITDIELGMNINNWFTNPYLFDFNNYGGSIMQNQEAQEVLKANGAADVFSVR